VINTCVPSLLGEDLREIVEGDDFILVDSPGYKGGMEEGYQAALESLHPAVDPDRPGVNIDGVSLSDPFSAGNTQEVARILHSARIPVGTVLCRDAADMARHASSLTIGTNGDFGSGVGKFLGGTLGFPALRATFSQLAAECSDVDISPVLAEIDRQEERVISACDKFLRRFDPPDVAIFSGESYGIFAADTLKRYLDAGILVVGTRNAVSAETHYPWPVEQLTGIEEVRRTLTKSEPDLVIGSSFERAVCPNAAFVGIIPPLRGRIRLAPTPIAGPNGTLHFVEEALNACMDNRS